MYSTASDKIWETCGKRLSGCHAGLWCVVSGRKLGDAAQEALEKSAAALGYGEKTCTFVTVQGDLETNGLTDRSNNGTTYGETDRHDKTDEHGGKNGSKAHSETGECDPENNNSAGYDMFTIVESIDPLCIVAADVAGAKALSDAYRQNIPLDASCRLFGRNAVAFHSFESLLDTAEKKQGAWALLKRLKATQS